MATVGAINSQPEGNGNTCKTMIATKIPIPTAGIAANQRREPDHRTYIAAAQAVQ